MASFRTVSFFTVLTFGLLLPWSEAFSLDVSLRATPTQTMAAPRSALLFASEYEGSSSSSPTSLRSTTVAASHGQNQTNAATSIEDELNNRPTMNTHDQDDTDDTKPIRKGYQRAEDWDAEQKSGKMTWEQKVQFDGLKTGNGVRQNEILMRHLHTF